ncbi:uncharacterized protein LOC142579155 [Dermacentor variabilis]|uniref:uncharacterized protein LOC142579155 n=1 Tax=Dermacentor variabilis TaxID=34621 RepID=UPI003F5CB109
MAQPDEEIDKARLRNSNVMSSTTGSPLKSLHSAGGLVADLSLSDNEDSLDGSPKDVSTILEAPQNEAQLEMEHLHDHSPVESFSEPEVEPTSLVVDELPLQDPDLSTEAENETLPVPSERHLQMSEQPSSESVAVQPELYDVPLKENKAAGMAEAITSEDLPTMQPDSANLTCNSLQDSAQTQLSPVPKTLPVPSERHLQMSEQPSSESAAGQPELYDVPLKENKAAGMAEAITSEDLPTMQPDSANLTCNSLQDSAQTQPSPVPSPKKLAPPPSEDQPVTPPLLQRNVLLVRRKTAPVLTKVPDSRSVDPASTPLIRARSVLANQYLQRIGHMRSAQGDLTCQLAEDTTSIEEATLEPPENCKKEEFEELTLKLHDAEQSAVTSQAHKQPEGDAKSKDFETLPVCGRIAFWRKRESDAVYKGIFSRSKHQLRGAPDSNVCKQGRLQISDTGLRPDPQQ